MNFAASVLRSGAVIAQAGHVLALVAGFGWLFFQEVPDGWTWLGAAVILSGALVITVAEARRR